MSLARRRGGNGANQYSNGKLICYYSDQRDNTTHGQKLVHQVSTDLENWGPVIDDVYVETVFLR